MLLALGFLLIGLAIVLSIFVYLKSDTLTDPTTASDALVDMLKDPLVTSRAYFTEPATGPIGDFVGYSPVSQDDWLHSLPHEESQDKGGKYDKIRSLI
jgi:hypothetical protein